MEKVITKPEIPEQKFLIDLAESEICSKLPPNVYLLLEGCPLVVPNTKAVLQAKAGDEQVRVEVRGIPKSSGVRSLQKLWTAPVLVPSDAPMSLLCNVTTIMVKELVEGLIRLPVYAKEKFGYEGKFARSTPFPEVVRMRGRNRETLRWYILFAPKDANFQIVPSGKALHLTRCG